MNTWLYLAQTVGVGSVSFLLGYVAGRAARDVHRIAQSVTTGGEPMHTRRPRRISANARQLTIAIVVVVLGIVTVVQGLIQSANVRRIIDCNAAYANALADAIDARSAGSQQAQDALDELMRTIGALAATQPVDEADVQRRRDASRKAVSDYVTKREEVKALQRNNPYPAPPRESCPAN